MLYVYGPTGKTRLEWHIGEPLPANVNEGEPILRAQADGDELLWLLAKMRETHKPAPNAAASFAANLTHPAEPARPSIHPITPGVVPDSLYELFCEVRRWREADYITAKSYAYFLDRWALLCVQLRAGQ